MAALLPLFRHATRAATPAADAELLDRFAAGRDEDAFAELVRRHGPVVYRVCRRPVGQERADRRFPAAFSSGDADAARGAGSWADGWSAWPVASRVDARTAGPARTRPSLPRRTESSDPTRRRT